MTLRYLWIHVEHDKVFLESEGTSAYRCITQVINGITPDHLIIIGKIPPSGYNDDPEPVFLILISFN